MAETTKKAVGKNGILKSPIYNFSFAGGSSSLIGRKEDLTTSKKVSGLTKQRAADFALSSFFAGLERQIDLKVEEK